MNILVYIPTYHSELKKKKKLSVKVVTIIWITTNFSITFHFYFLIRLIMSNFKIISSYHSTINLYMTSMAAESFVKPMKIYRRYIGPSCTRSALARQLIWKGILIYRRYIGAGYTRSALARQLNFLRFSPLMWTCNYLIANFLRISCTFCTNI